MKTARFLFTIIAFAALTPGAGFAGEPSSQTSERVPHKNHATSRVPVSELHQPGLKKAATAANGGLMLNKMQNNHKQPARPTLGGRTIAPLPGVVHARSATKAVAGGGAAAAGVKHPGLTLNGADFIKHKTY
jgi:hypothetical protein